ncbi:MAG TPA: hypothetical protein VGL94_13840 [Ktedonobacteraceae bacterium]|jgi:hypothetical protein
MERRFQIIEPTGSSSSDRSLLIRKKSVSDLRDPIKEDIEKLKRQCTEGEDLHLKDNVEKLAQQFLNRDIEEIELKLSENTVGEQCVTENVQRRVWTKRRELVNAQSLLEDYKTKGKDDRESAWQELETTGASKRFLYALDEARVKIEEGSSAGNLDTTKVASTIGFGQDLASVPASSQADESFEMASAMERGAVQQEALDSGPPASHEHPRRGEAIKLLQQLGIPTTAKNVESTTGIYDQLVALDRADKGVKEATETLLKAFPKTTTRWQRIKELNSPKRAYIDGQIIEWQDQINPPNKLSSKINKPMAWLVRKNGRVGKLGVASLQAVISSAFPSIIAKRYVWATVLTSLIPSLVTNRLFEGFPVPAGPILNTMQWETANIGGYFFQKLVGQVDSCKPTTGQVDNSTTYQVGNFTTHQVGNFTTREFSDFMDERLGNFTGEPTGDEIYNVIISSADDFLNQKGYPITFRDPNIINHPRTFTGHPVQVGQLETLDLDSLD